MQPSYIPQQNPGTYYNYGQPASPLVSVSPIPMQSAQPMGQPMGVATGIPIGQPNVPYGMCPYQIPGNSMGQPYGGNQLPEKRKCKHCNYIWNSVTIEKLKKGDAMIGCLLGILLIIPGAVYCCVNKTRKECCHNCRKCEDEENYCCECTC